MGYVVEAKCRDCGEVFEVEHGGGFAFHLVRCDKCGGTKTMSFDDLGELHLRYLKGLPGPFCVASAEYDSNIRKHAPLQPISEEEYYREIDALAGKCKCGGKYNLDALPRCPKCRSTRIDEGDVALDYD